jgi:hypothetical protein
MICLKHYIQNHLILPPKKSRSSTLFSQESTSCLNQINPIYLFIYYLFLIYFSIILQIIPRHSEMYHVQIMKNISE